MDNRAQVGGTPVPVLLLVFAVIISIIAFPVIDDVDKTEYQKANEDIVVETGADGVIRLVVISVVLGVLSFVAVGVRSAVDPWIGSEEEERHE